MSDITEWARERWTKLYSTTQAHALDMAMTIAQEAYERGVNQSKFGVHLPPVVATVPGIVPLASRPASSMTVRERFAMAAMQGVLMRHPIHPEDEMLTMRRCTELADALIALLRKKEGE